MDLDDEIWLKKYNTKKSKLSQCSEDQFEEVMNFFEQTSSLKQPFAAVDNAPVLSYADMEAAFDETIEDTSRRFARDIYEYWKLKREKHLNKPLMPMLKFERNQGSEEDSDPYICFRRREIRQTRKTRGRDAQITEKLKKLRLELEQARQLMATVKQREILRRDQLQLEKSVFLKRCDVKETKRNLGIKDDDEDLINQRVSTTNSIDEDQWIVSSEASLPDLISNICAILQDYQRSDGESSSLARSNSKYFLRSLSQKDMEQKLTVPTAGSEAKTQTGHSDHVPRTTRNGAQDSSRKRRRSSSRSSSSATRRRKGAKGGRNQPHDPRVDDEASCVEQRLGRQHLAPNHTSPGKREPVLSYSRCWVSSDASCICER